MMPIIAATQGATMLTGAQMKALNNIQRDLSANAFDAYARGLQNSANPLANAAAMHRTQCQLALQAEVAMATQNALLGIKPMAVEPKPEPKGPPDVWHWLAYLEDTGKLRWWHPLWALLLEKFRPLSRG